MKTCSKCKAPKHESEFKKNSAAKDRLSTYCKVCAHDYYKNYYPLNQLRIQERVKARYHSDPKVANKVKERSALQRELQNPEENRVYHRLYRRKQRLENPEINIKESLTSRLHWALKSSGVQKKARTMELLGCPIVWLKVHLESKFRPGMTWENRGSVWHIDHIKPCAKFTLSDPEQQKACFHWTNLQPLFARENLQKGSSYHHA